MDAFISGILTTLKEQGGRAVRVFPPDAGVLISFAERLSNEVVSETYPPGVCLPLTFIESGGGIYRLVAYSSTGDFERSISQSNRCKLPRGLAHSRRRY